ncbi:transposase domain-containing protein [Nonomuraea candida]|uniref:transposase domain-containing protein n=1 Tax=Nonomuraea candida TaxID=359159 RepID=UPI0006939B76|nr:transposase domain-containing protein [Nonomuraea candida]
MGELTALVPVELVDAVLEETRGVQRRLRALPSRVGVYFLLAMCLFPEVGYLLAWQKLTASLTALPVVTPTAKALRDLRRRVGSAPMWRLFEVLSGPRALVGAVFGPTGEGESGHARHLLHLLTPDMLVSWDKGFDGNAFLAQVSATGAQVLGRLRSNRRTPILAPSPTAPISR